MIRALIEFSAFLLHVLTSPVTLALSAGLLGATWLICNQVRRQKTDGTERLLTSEWLGA